jgi:hypothetical protein
MRRSPTMTVRDLIIELQRQVPDREVRFEFPAHDYWRTNLACEVVQVESTIVQYDGYHDQFRIPKEELCNEDVEHNKDARKVVVLRGYHR